MSFNSSLVCFCLLFFLSTFADDQTVYNLGGLFDKNDTDEDAFRSAIKVLNEKNGDAKFAAFTEIVDAGGAFEAMTKTCSFLSQETVAVFGPKTDDNINIVESVCDNKDIPHIITRWTAGATSYNHSVNFFPSAEKLSLAYIAIIDAWDWKSFTVLYEDNESLLRTATLIREAKAKGLSVSVKQLDETGNGIYRTTLREARDSGEIRFVIDCSIDVLEAVLFQTQQVGMLTSDYNYFVTNLDFQIIDTEPFQYAEANITGIRIVNPENPLLSEILEEGSISSLQVETALIIDAVNVVSKAVEQSVSNTMKDVTCDTTESFRDGSTLINSIRHIEYTGLTGLIKFDVQGLRSFFELDVLELHEDGFSKVGIWNPNSTKGLSIRRTDSKVVEEDENSLRNKSFTVITCLTYPYGMLVEATDPQYGNKRFEGFGIDLIDALAKNEGFSYNFIIREDKKNGAKNKETGKWSGMIGDVMEGRADLAITDLTITSEREEAVDFTSPFMNLGISILAKKPSKAPPSFFSFADPFGVSVWSMLACAYLVVTLCFFLMGRLCPDEWTNPYPCIEEPEFLINQFSLSNSFWFTIGSLMQQGTEIAPIGVSTRMLAGMWWFFVLIMVSSYTANLAAFLTTVNPIELFVDLESLVENMDKHGIRMGAKANGATAQFFKDKDKEPFISVAKYMEEHPEDMVTDNNDGVMLAENSTYAFFMESTSIEYETQRHCDLQQYGKLLDDKGYGIAMRKNSTYRMRLSTAILKLQASGELDKLKRKWWEERRGGGQCSGATEDASATPLNLENVEGVFYVTFFGALCSILLVSIEMLLATWRLSHNAKLPFGKTLITELKSSYDFDSNTKEVPGSPEDDESKSQSESPKESGSMDGNNHLKPAPYGFISGSKDQLTAPENSKA